MGGVVPIGDRHVDFFPGTAQVLYHRQIKPHHNPFPDEFLRIQLFLCSKDPRLVLNLLHVVHWIGVEDDDSLVDAEQKHPDQREQLLVNPVQGHGAEDIESGPLSSLMLIDRFDIRLEHARLPTTQDQDAFSSRVIWRSLRIRSTSFQQTLIDGNRIVPLRLVGKPTFVEKTHYEDALHPRSWPCILRDYTIIVANAVVHDINSAVPHCVPQQSWFFGFQLKKTILLFKRLDKPTYHWYFQVWFLEREDVALVAWSLQ